MAEREVEMMKENKKKKKQLIMLCSQVVTMRETLAKGDQLACKRDFE